MQDFVHSNNSNYILKTSHGFRDANSGLANLVQ